MVKIHLLAVSYVEYNFEDFCFLDELWQIQKCILFPSDLPYGWEQETDEKGQVIYVE